MKPAIRVENLSKQFRLGANRSGYRTLRESFSGVTSSVWNRLHGPKAPLSPGDSKRDGVPPTARNATQSPDNFWALKDVSFDVQPGEVVGIIGRNGAGKSTLLKILSRITEPTRGRVELRGRVGSLLEVGTGFHPELSGRENVYMNGTILGMTKREISRRFDEIVSFSGVERFLDTPIKRYSSGMQVRLAFAVAAHLEPEILIVDEVLAVGDVEFQKKCLGKMQDVSADGRTVLLVSHNLTAVSSLCTRAICLSRGSVTVAGNVQSAIAAYQGDSLGADTHEWRGEFGNDLLTITHTWVRSLACDGRFTTEADLEVGVVVKVHRCFEGIIIGFRLYSEFGYPLAYTLFDDRESTPPPTTQPAVKAVCFRIPGNTLARGRYRIGFEIGQAWISAAVLDSPGELIFDLENINGLGRRYAVKRKEGFTSLLRPDWAVT